jgi:hypothetical protein
MISLCDGTNSLCLQRAHGCYNDLNITMAIADGRTASSCNNDGNYKVEIHDLTSTTIWQSSSNWMIMSNSHHN